MASKTCHQDISKNIVARSFKHGQLVEDDEWNPFLMLVKKKIALCKFGH